MKQHAKHDVEIVERKAEAAKPKSKAAKPAKKAKRVPKIKAEKEAAA